MPTTKILATFTGMSGTTPGANPKGGLIEDSAGNLYGTTAGGGAYSDGTAFEIPKTATGYGALTTLVSFNTSSSSGGPMAGLVADSAGDLFGTTYGGGASYAGTVFEIAKGATAPTILGSFNFGSASTTTGEGPGAALNMDSAGDLFGTTLGGGAYRDGAVFEVPRSLVSATGYGALTLVASFNFADGSVPRAGLTLDNAGDLVGTTSQGGAYSDGTVFVIKKNGSAYATTPTTLFSFNGNDGAAPLAGLITDKAGDLFGTTLTGSGSTGGGTVFELKTANTSTGYASTPTVLFSFNLATTGNEPESGLIMDAAGDLFGTTPQGGPGGAGTVFELQTANTSTGYASTPVIVSNSGSYGGLLADKAGDLFAQSGGGGGYGTVIEIQGTPWATQGIDYRLGPNTSVDPLVAAASSVSKVFNFVGEYLGGDASYLTAAKTSALIGAGLQIASIYENANMASMSYYMSNELNNGISVGEAAYKDAISDGQGSHPGSAIYFAVDTDIPINSTTLLTDIKMFFMGIKQGFQDEANILSGGTAQHPSTVLLDVGVYGAGITDSTIKGAGLADYSWLAESTGWQGSSTYTGWDIKQTSDASPKHAIAQSILPSVNFSATTYDALDITHGSSFGQW